jgi:uncharacterized protein with GYD domain
MAKYLLFGRYSSAGAAAVKAEGLTARKRAVEAFGEATGGKVLGWWAVAETDWDFVILSENDSYDSANQVALRFTTYASGAFEATDSLTLVETEDADAAISSMVGYRAPGEQTAS